MRDLCAGLYLTFLKVSYQNVEARKLHQWSLQEVASTRYTNGLAH